MKKILIDERAQKELSKFSLKVQEAFGKRFTVLSEEGKLDFPEARKLTKDLFEVRIKVGGAYRGIYFYGSDDYIVILHCFQKKSQKTPPNSVKLAERRLKDYDTN